METLGTIVVILVVCIAVFYLYRHFAAKFKQAETPCGCGGCAGCTRENITAASAGINDPSAGTDREKVE